MKIICIDEHFYNNYNKFCIELLSIFTISLVLHCCFALLRFQFTKNDLNWWTFLQRLQQILHWIIVYFYDNLCFFKIIFFMCFRFRVSFFNCCWFNKINSSTWSFTSFSIHQPFFFLCISQFQQNVMQDDANRYSLHNVFVLSLISNLQTQRGQILLTFFQHFKSMFYIDSYFKQFFIETFVDRSIFFRNFVWDDHVICIRINWIIKKIFFQWKKFLRSLFDFDENKDSNIVLRIKSIDWQISDFQIKIANNKQIDCISFFSIEKIGILIFSFRLILQNSIDFIDLVHNFNKFLFFIIFQVFLATTFFIKSTNVIVFQFV